MSQDKASRVEISIKIVVPGREAYDPPRTVTAVELKETAEESSRDLLRRAGQMTREGMDKTRENMAIVIDREDAAREKEQEDRLARLGSNFNRATPAGNRRYVAAAIQNQKR